MKARCANKLSREPDPDPAAEPSGGYRSVLNCLAEGTGVYLPCLDEGPCDWKDVTQPGLEAV